MLTGIAAPWYSVTWYLNRNGKQMKFRIQGGHINGYEGKFDTFIHVLIVAFMIDR